MAYKVLERIAKYPRWIQETRDTMNLLKQYLRPLESQHGVLVQSEKDSPLVALILQNYHPERVIRIAVQMKHRGYYVAAVNPPACDLRAPRLRLTAPRGLADTEIRNFVDSLDEVFKQTRYLEAENPLKELGDLLNIIGI
jgi:7-keto-8-aminopelargonate synthetase-like enzyme